MQYAYGSFYEHSYYLLRSEPLFKLHTPPYMNDVYLNSCLTKLLFNVILSIFHLLQYECVCACVCVFYETKIFFVSVSVVGAKVEKQAYAADV